MNILVKRKSLHLNDPRCYNGVCKDAEYIYGPWEVLDYNIHPDKAEDRLKFWKELNDYAVSQRGESARSQFKIEK